MGLLPDGDCIKSSDRCSRGENLVLKFPIPKLETLLEDYG